MKITNIISQHRRDFTFEATCEGCGHVQINDSGYDDANYYDNVVPNQKCKKCGESTNSLGETPDKITPRVPPGLVI